MDRRGRRIDECRDSTTAIVVGVLVQKPAKGVGRLELEMATYALAQQVAKDGGGVDGVGLIPPAPTDSLIGHAPKIIIQKQSVLGSAGIE